MGKLVVEPGGVNAIPSHVTAWLDARGAEESDVTGTVDQLTAVSDGLGAVVTRESWTPKTMFDPDLTARLSGVLDQPPILGTGAGHDAGILANTGISTAMIFVRNPSGISHSPAEHAERVDCLAGVEALARVTLELAG